MYAGFSGTDEAFKTCYLSTDVEVQQPLILPQCSEQPDQRPAQLPLILHSPVGSTSSTSLSLSFTVKADDYVLVKQTLETRRGQKTNFAYYVGHAMQWMNVSLDDGISGWRMKCMRRYRSSVNEFVFPCVDDISTYSLDDIIEVLSPPKVDDRGVHHFRNDLLPYVPHLR